MRQQHKKPKPDTVPLIILPLYNGGPSLIGTFLYGPLFQNYYVNIPSIKSQTGISPKFDLVPNLKMAKQQVCTVRSIDPQQ